MGKTGEGQKSRKPYEEIGAIFNGNEVPKYLFTRMMPYDNFAYFINYLYYKLVSK